MSKRRKLAQFLADAPNEDPRRKNYEQRVRQALLNGKLSAADICERFGLTNKETHALLADYLAAGANLVQIGNRYTIDRHLAPDSDAAWKVVAGKDGHHRFGFVADTHIGSKHYRDDVLNGLYDWFAREGVTTVYHCGNWIEGEARFNKHELDDRAHGMQAQIDLMVELYPQRKGITTYYVTGDDHEGWYCFEPGVEILTEDGWKDLSQVADGDVVAGKDDAGEFVWQPVNRAIRKHHEGHLVRFADRSMDVAVTPDHRFEVWRKSSMHGRPAKCIMTAAEILAEFKPRCFGIPRATEKWTGHNPGRIKIGRLVQMRYNDHPRIQRPDDLDAADLAILCAWFATEGSTHKNVVGIAQSRDVNPDKYVEIRSLIQRLGYRCGESANGLTFSAPDLAHWLREHCGTYSDNKRLPHWVKDMPEDVLALVFDALIKGDGHARESGWRFYSKSPALRADVTEIAQKLGYAVSEVDHGERYSWMTLSISAERSVAYLFRPPALEPYSGDVFCVSVPTQRIYVRKHGKAFWSMNCQREGVDIGRLLMDTARRAGRRDLVNLGYKEAFITLEHPKTKRHTRMLIDHPGGGSSYAYSYAPQKRVEAAQGGEKPGLWAFGHWHKHGYFQARNVHILLVPCTKDLDTFGRKKGLEYHLGGVLLDLWQDEGGAIKRVIPQFELWLDRGYYNQQYNLSGPVAKR